MLHFSKPGFQNNERMDKNKYQKQKKHLKKHRIKDKKDAFNMRTVLGREALTNSFEEKIPFVLRWDLKDWAEFAALSPEGDWTSSVILWNFVEIITGA